MATPLVSVIVPAYKSAATLRDTLQSVLKQTEKRWEVIVVDDGSPDKSSEVAQKFSYFDQRFKVIRQANAGPCAARNTGIEKATGKWAIFLDADDWLAPNYMAVMTAAGDKGNPAAVYGRFRYAKEDGSLTARIGGHTGTKPLFEALAESNVQGLPSSVMGRMSVIREVGGFTVCRPYSCDWDMWGRLARRKEGVVGIADQVSFYRMRPSSMGRQAPLLLRDATETLRQMHSADPRVKSPAPAYANGAPADLLPLRIAQYTLYCSGLIIATGDLTGAKALLDTVPTWPKITAEAAAGYLFYAVCFARCEGEETADRFWPEIGPAVGDLMQDLERRIGTPGLAAEMRQHIERFSLGKIAASPTPAP